MSKLGISTGTIANDGTGDSLLQGGVKINSNFTEIYNSIGDGTNINIGVGKTLITTVLSSGNVGIGSTIPTSKLDVSGNGKFSGIVTALTFSGQVSSGVGTITRITGTNLNYTGISTVGSLSIGSNEVVSSARQLKNISSLDATTTATIESAIQVAPNNFNDLQITGISTFTNGPVFVGSGTSTGTALQRLQVTGGAYISGNLGIGTTNPGTQLQISSSVPTIRFQETDATTDNKNWNVTAWNQEFYWQGLDDSGVGGNNLFAITRSGNQIQTFEGRNAGTTWFEIDNSTQRVGIGTSIPTGQLQVASGPVIVGSANSTGTASQRLQVTGNAYISGEIGIGTTRPTTGASNIGIHIDEGQINVTRTSGLNIGIFSGSTTGDLIRITQLGTGNALVVEDSTNPDETPFVVGAAGSVGVGTHNPTARLHIGPGSSSANGSPLKFSQGNNLSVVESGAIEYDGTTFFATPNTLYGRSSIVSGNYTSGIGSTLSPTATGETTPQFLYPTTNESIMLPQGTYYVQSIISITRGNTSTTSATARLQFVGPTGVGTAVGNFSGKAVSSIAAGGASSLFMFNAVGLGVDNVVTAANATAGGVYNIEMSGILKITTAGTITPRYSLSANLTGATTPTTVTAPNYMIIQSLDTQSAAAFGPVGAGWS